MTSEHINFVMFFTVQDAQMARFEEITKEQRRISASEQGTTVYETYRHADGSFCHVERYADENALITHVQNTSSLLEEWMGIVELKQTVAAGPLSESIVKQFSLEAHYLPYAAM